jgi:hypothetical protein
VTRASKKRTSQGLEQLKEKYNEARALASSIRDISNET